MAADDPGQECPGDHAANGTERALNLPNGDRSPDDHHRSRSRRHPGTPATVMSETSPAAPPADDESRNHGNRTVLLLGVLAIRAGRHSDLDERRRRIRAWVAPAVSAYLAAVVVVQAWVMLAGQSTPRPLVVLNLAIINGLAALALASFVKIRVLNWLDFTDPPTPDRGCAHLSRAQRPRQPRPSAPARDALCTRGLDHPGLAKLLGTQEHVLRRVIHLAASGFEFHDFLHTHRLPRGRAASRDPAARRSPCSRSRWKSATDRSGRSTGHSGNASE